MLFFVDETWQTIAGQRVGALGAVAIPAANYNAFCREVFMWKGRVLGARELSDAEIKGSTMFAKSAFRALEHTGRSKMLEAADEMFHTLEKYGGRLFIVWTAHGDLLTLRNPHTTQLSAPYKKLLYDLREHMRGRGSSIGSINFDQRTVKEDAATACAVSNFLVRTRGWWKLFMHVPNFTVSSVSPGLQAADLVAYLGANLADETHRPELAPYIARAKALGRVRRVLGPRVAEAA
jgi:uncharacterized protein DUF3800